MPVCPDSYMAILLVWGLARHSRFLCPQIQIGAMEEGTPQRRGLYTRRTPMRTGAMKWIALVMVLLLAGTVSLAGKGGGGKPPKDPPPEPDPDPAIALYTPGSGGYGNLRVMNADGTNVTLLLQGGARTPSWSPDGEQLVFTGDVQGQGPGIYVINVDGTGLHKVVSMNKATAALAAWSPAPVPGVGGDQYRIAYTDESPAGSSVYELFLVNLDGSGVVQVTDSPVRDEMFPTWSPSASKLLVRLGDKVEPRDYDLWALYDFASDSYTMHQHEGSLAGAVTWWPDWSKTSENEVMWQARGDLWIVYLDDPSNPTQVTNTPDLQESAFSWSPDDLEIVFRSAKVKGGRLRNHTLDVMGTDGTNRRTVLDGYPIPVWRRNP